MRNIFYGSLRSPNGFQCFPSLTFRKVSNYSFLPMILCSCELLSCDLTLGVVCISSPTLIHVHKSIQYSPKWISSFSCGPTVSTLQSEVRPTISRFSSTLMAHYRSRIGSLVGWGLPVTLGAPTPLLGSSEVSLAQGGQ